MYKRSLVGIALWLLASGCTEANAFVLLVDPHAEEDKTLKEIGDKLRFAAYDFDVYSIDLDKDGFTDDKLAWLSIQVSSEPGCDSREQFLVSYYFAKTFFDVSDEDDVAFTPGDTLQGGGVTFDPEYGLLMPTGDRGITELFIRDNRGRGNITSFVDENDAILELDAISEEKLSARLTSILRWQRNASLWATPVEMILFSSIIDATRCESY